MPEIFCKLAELVGRILAERWLEAHRDAAAPKGGDPTGAAAVSSGEPVVEAMRMAPATPLSKD